MLPGYELAEGRPTGLHTLKFCAKSTDSFGKYSSACAITAVAYLQNVRGSVFQSTFDTHSKATVTMHTRERWTRCASGIDSLKTALSAGQMCGPLRLRLLDPFCSLSIRARGTFCSLAIKSGVSGEKQHCCCCLLHAGSSPQRPLLH